MNKISDEDIVNLCEIKELDYIKRFVKNEQTYLTCVCNKHYKPYMFEISFRNLRNLKGNCPKCSGKNMTTEDIKYRVEELLNVPVEIIGEYKNMKTPIKTRCTKCGNEWDANVVSLCQGSGCNKCKNSKPKKEHDKFVKEISEVQPNLIITSRYNGDANNVSYKCKIDGYEGLASAGRLLNKTTQCTCCVKKKMHESQMLSYEIFKERMRMVNPQIEIISGYDGTESKVTFRCGTHGRTYVQRASDAMHGKCGCAQCVSSKGEKEIEKLLNEFNVEFKTQYKFDDCYDIKLLPFDFYIPSLHLAIEYQGQQHYKPVQFGGCSMEEAIQNFERQQRHDKIKSDYCRDNGINLLSISYKEYDNLYKIIKKQCVK